MSETALSSAFSTEVYLAGCLGSHVNGGVRSVLRLWTVYLQYWGAAAVMLAVLLLWASACMDKHGVHI